MVGQMSLPRRGGKVGGDVLGLPQGVATELLRTWESGIAMPPNPQQESEVGSTVSPWAAADFCGKVGVVRSMKQDPEEYVREVHC